METKEPVEVEVIDVDIELQVYDKVSASVDAAMERCANIVLCYDTPKDIESSRSWIFQHLRTLNAPIAQVHKIAKAQLLVDGRAMDAMKNKLLAKVKTQIEEKYAPIKLIEDAETKKKADEEAKIKAEEEKMEADRQAEIEAREKAVREREEKVRAEHEAMRTADRERRIAEKAKEKAKEDAQQAVRDAENAKNAAEERLRQDAVKAEDAKKQAIVDADNAKAAAVQKVREESAINAQVKERAIMEDQRIAREKKDAEDMAETERINNEQHRSTIHREILRLILSRCVSEGSAKALIRDIVNGKISHTKITY